MRFVVLIAVDDVNWQSHSAHRVTDICDLDVRTDQSLQFVFGRKATQVILVTGSSYDLFHFTDFDVYNVLDECCNIVFGQMVYVVIPVANIALLLPRCKLSWIITSEVSHEDVKAGAMGQVGCTLVTAMDNPCLR